MKENEVRERVQAFLKNTVRLVVVPASMGIGLALIGCGDSSEDTGQDAGADVVAMAGQNGQSGAGGGSASGGAVAVYSTSFFDAGAGGSGGTTSTGGAVAVYSASFFDAGAGGSGGSLATIHPAYMAVLPDAAMSTGGITGKYAAPMSSGGSVSSGGGMRDAGPAFDGGSSDLRTGGTTTPVTRYGGIFPGSSSSNGSS